MKEKDFKGSKVQDSSLREVVEAAGEGMAQITSPACCKPIITMQRDFNLMFETKVGATADTVNVAYFMSPNVACFMSRNGAGAIYQF